MYVHVYTVADKKSYCFHLVLCSVDGAQVPFRVRVVPWYADK